MLRLLFLLLSILCGALDWLMPSESGGPAGDCSENPYYAKAEIVLDWYAQHPELAPTSAQLYSHAVLDSTYDGLFRRGKVPPVPPTCMVTANQTTPIYDSSSETVIGEMAAGDVAELHGRSEDWAWWFVLVDGAGWGRVRAADVVVQPETEIDLVPIR